MKITKNCGYIIVQGNNRPWNNNYIMQYTSSESFPQIISAEIRNIETKQSSSTKLQKELKIAQILPINLKPDEAGILNSRLQEGKLSTILSVNSVGRTLGFTAIKEGTVTFGIGFENKSGNTNPVYQLNQNISPNFSAYIFGSNQNDNTAGLNFSFGGSKESTTGNIFIERNLNTSETFGRAVIGF